MRRTTLVTTTALVWLVMAFGCEPGTNAADPPHKTIERTTTWAPRPVQQVADPAAVSAPRPADPAPAPTTPPVDDAADTPSSVPTPPLPTAAPRRPPAQYQDGCGRPLVA